MVHSSAPGQHGGQGDQERTLTRKSTRASAEPPPPGCPPMAPQRLPLVAALAWALLALPSFWAQEAHCIRTPCQQHCRYRKPPVSDHWSGHWVPLMIIVGGCCGLAWCILFVGCEASQRARKELPQLPQLPPEEAEEAEEEEIPPEKTPLPPAVQRELSRILFRRDSQNSNVGNGIQERQENPVSDDVSKSVIKLERKGKSERLSADKSILQLSREATSKSLVSEPNQSIIQLAKKATSSNHGILPIGSVTQVGSNILLEKVGSATQVEDGFGGQLANNPMYERVGSVTRLASQTILETSRRATLFRDEALPRLPKESENSNPGLWSFVEKELEILLQALRLRRPVRSATSASEKLSAMLSREDKAVGTDAKDVPCVPNTIAMNTIATNTPITMHMPNTMDMPNTMATDMPITMHMPNAMAMDMPNTMPMRMPSTMAMDMPNTMPMRMPSTTAMDMLNTIATSMSNTIATNMSNTMASNMSNPASNMSNSMTNTMAMDMSNTMLNMMPMDMPNTLARDMSNTMPMDMPNTMRMDMSNTMPMDMPNMMPMDMPNTMRMDTPSVATAGTGTPPPPSHQPRMEENSHLVRLIICEIPRSRSPSPVRGRGRGRKQRCVSRKRK
ncbi:uncharacterized protein LOC134294363 [Anolis carolinensis]|uniref:uncharacterized protein LOC134294363 n=1 Tax=Anolis carolinensis TaxID=28377 RepID=UPI002F2B9059